MKNFLLLDVLPFFIFLLSISFIHPIFPRFWNKHSESIILGLTFLSIIFIGAIRDMGQEIIITIFSEYLPFCLLIVLLYLVSSCFSITVQAQPTPFVNTMFLFVSTLLSSVMGTTGSTMVFIRPFIDLNKDRKFKIHSIIAFICLVSNIGGCLSPIGDPPLFIGFLRGVPFLWPLKNLFTPFLFVFLTIICGYFLLDCFLFKKEKGKEMVESEKRTRIKIKIQGKYYIFFFLAIILTLLFLNENYFRLDGKFLNMIRSMVFMMLSIFIFKVKGSDFSKNFSWKPLRNVCLIFLGIFVTSTPIIAAVHGGSHGIFKEWLDFFHNIDGKNFIYFWIPGTLSVILDNCPTYILFFEILEKTGLRNGALMALSLGTVFMGALTYIGNSPNLLVKEIAEDKGIKMPSFFVYFFWTSIALIPCFIALTLVFLKSSS